MDKKSPEYKKAIKKANDTYGPKSSIYRSSYIVKTYKDLGGKIGSSPKGSPKGSPKRSPKGSPKRSPTKGLTRWFKEEWVQVVPYLEKKGVNILAIDPNLGMWHPETPNELKPVIQKQIIEAIPEIKKIAPVFIVAPRTNNLLNIELVELILSQGVDFIRTHDVVALKETMHRFRRCSGVLE